jgi:hypothetical protein
MLSSAVLTSHSCLQFSPNGYFRFVWTAWLRKEAKIKARKFRVARRTSCTPQQQRNAAQRRDWPIYEARLQLWQVSQQSTLAFFR